MNVSLMIALALLYDSVYLWFHAHSVVSDVSLLSCSHTSACHGEHLLSSSLYPEMIADPFYLGGISLSIDSFWGPSCTLYLDIISSKNGTLVHLKWHLSLFNLRFSVLCTYITCLSIVSCSWPFSSYPTNWFHLWCQIHLTDAWIFFSVLCLNMSPSGAVPLGSLAYVYLLNRQADVV